MTSCAKKMGKLLALFTVDREILHLIMGIDPVGCNLASTGLAFIHPHCFREVLSRGGFLSLRPEPLAQPLP